VVPGIYEDYPHIEGLVHASSMNACSPALALYERAEAALPAAPALHRTLSDPLLDAIVEEAAARFGYALDP
jgi:hypothetical protein